MGHSIHVQPSGHRFVAEQGESILDAALRQGFTLPYNCRNGACGTCIGRVLEGRVRYDQQWPALADLNAELGEALFCHAIPEDDLVIESKEIAVPPEVRIRTLPVKVVGKELLCHDVIRLWLKPPEALPLRFLAGQYLDILTAEGRRSFSIANAPEDSNLIELHVRHVEGGEFTHYVFDELQEKTIWRIEAPLGTFFLRQDTDRPLLLMGGGTGFAPLKGILEHAFRSGDNRPMHLFWGVRAKRDLYMAELPRQWEREHPNFRFTPVLSEPMAEDKWEGETGFVHETLLRAYPDLSGYDVYMSGPPVMIHAARDAFLEHGLNRERAFSDAFEFNTLPGHAAA